MARFSPVDDDWVGLAPSRHPGLPLFLNFGCSRTPAMQERRHAVNGEHELDSLDRSVMERRPYEKLRLIEYGRIAEITQGGTLFAGVETSIYTSLAV